MYLLLWLPVKRARRYVVVVAVVVVLSSVAHSLSRYTEPLTSSPDSLSHLTLTHVLQTKYNNILN